MAKSDSPGGRGGTTLLPQVSRYLLGSDLSGLPTLARVLNALPKEASGHIVVSAPRDFPVADYLPKTSLTIQVTQEKETANNLITLFRGFPPPDYAWFVGEFQAAQAVQAFFREELKANSLLLPTGAQRTQTPDQIATDKP